jgi:hypothetical protein
MMSFFNVASTPKGAVVVRGASNVRKQLLKMNPNDFK